MKEPQSFVIWLVFSLCSLSGGFGERAERGLALVIIEHALNDFINSERHDSRMGMRVVMSEGLFDAVRS